MNLSMRWLNEFVDIGPIAPRDRGYDNERLKGRML